MSGPAREIWVVRREARDSVEQVHAFRRSACCSYRGVVVDSLRGRDRRPETTLCMARKRVNVRRDCRVH
jgi:hypothetical protein